MAKRRLPAHRDATSTFTVHVGAQHSVTHTTAEWEARRIPWISNLLTTQPLDITETKFPLDYPDHQTPYPIEDPSMVVWILNHPDEIPNVILPYDYLAITRVLGIYADFPRGNDDVPDHTLFKGRLLQYWLSALQCVRVYHHYRLPSHYEPVDEYNAHFASTLWSTVESWDVSRARNAALQLLTRVLPATCTTPVRKLHGRDGLTWLPLVHQHPDNVVLAGGHAFFQGTRRPPPITSDIDLFVVGKTVSERKRVWSQVIRWCHVALAPVHFVVFPTYALILTPKLTRHWQVIFTEHETVYDLLERFDQTCCQWFFHASSLSWYATLAAYYQWKADVMVIDDKESTTARRVTRWSQRFGDCVGHVRLVKNQYKVAEDKMFIPDPTMRPALVRSLIKGLWRRGQLFEDATDVMNNFAFRAAGTLRSYGNTTSLVASTESTAKELVDSLEICSCGRLELVTLPTAWIIETPWMYVPEQWGSRAQRTVPVSTKDSKFLTLMNAIDRVMAVSTPTFFYKGPFGTLSAYMYRSDDESYRITSGMEVVVRISLHHRWRSSKGSLSCLRWVVRDVVSTRKSTQYPVVLAIDGDAATD